MTFLDQRTVLFISGMLYLFMPMVVLLGLREQRNAMVANWVAGGEIFGLGILLVAGRGFVPDWVSYDLAHLCLFAGNLVRVHALRLEIHGTRKPHAVVGLLAVLFGLYLTARATDLWQLHSYYVSLFTLALTFGWLGLLSRQLAQQSRLSSARWMGHLYLLLAAIICIRLLQVMLGHASPGIMSNDPFSMAMPLGGMFTAVLGNTIYMGVYLERAVRRQIEQAQESARLSENMRLSNQIAQLDRQRGMGLIATSLAHEISQPLTNIHMIAERAELDALKTQASDPMRVRNMTDIMHNVEHATAIVGRLRNYIKAKDSTHQRVDLVDIHHNVLQLLGDWLQSQGAQIHAELPASPVHVMADPVQISQILVNLYRNAVQASAGQDQHHLRIAIGLTDGWAMLTVKDNGPGFPAAMLQGKSEPLFSAKADGLGVGLNISRNIAQQHQGHLTLANAPEGGAMATLSLPAA